MKKWFPEWHVMQVIYRDLTTPSTMIGYIGHPFRAPSKEWYYKTTKRGKWKPAKGFDKAIRKLVKIHGKGGAEHTYPVPYHLRDEWLPDEVKK